MLSIKLTDNSATKSGISLTYLYAERKRERERKREQDRAYVNAREKLTLLYHVY